MKLYRRRLLDGATTTTDPTPSIPTDSVTLTLDASDEGIKTITAAYGGNSYSTTSTNKKLELSVAKNSYRFQ